MIKSFEHIMAIRNARMDRGLSRSQLALMCGLKPSLLAEFEYGERPICRDTFDKIMAALSRVDVASA